MKKSRITTPSDYCNKVYDWEDTLPCIEKGDKITLKECGKYARRIRKEHGMTHRNFKVLDGRGSRYARGNPFEIHLPRHARNEYYVIHEIAHSIVNTFQPEELHGPWFVGFLMHLLKMYKGVPYSHMEKSAKEHGIEYHRVWRKLGVITKRTRRSNTKAARSHKANAVKSATTAK